MKYSVPSPTPGRTSSIFNNSFRTTSPLPPPANSNVGCLSAAAKRYKYLRRLLQYKQMDFEFALWQMLYLFISPQKVYRNFYYRKQTKSQFARDDPAFLVLLIGWLIGSSIGVAVSLGLGLGGYLLLTLYVVFVDCIGSGLLIATALWFITNRYLRRDPLLTEVVEWGYAFDIHLNAFFPPLIILHVIEIIFHPLLVTSEIGRLSGNMLWMIAAGYYMYITFLGYTCLANLQNTQALLYPVPLLIFIFLLSSALGWNFSEMIVYFYKFRIVQHL